MDLTQYTHLATARLDLRPMTGADPDELAAALNDFEVVRWLSRVPHPYTRADALDIIARREAEPAPAWLIYDERGLCGGMSLYEHLGFWLSPKVWGRGYATEAARAVLAAHFADPQAGDVGSSYFVGNDASARVLAKLGFRKVGPIKLPSKSLGHEVDATEVVLSRADWERSNA